MTEILLGSLSDSYSSFLASFLGSAHAAAYRSDSFFLKVAEYFLVCLTPCMAHLVLKGRNIATWCQHDKNAVSTFVHIFCGPEKGFLQVILPRMSLPSSWVPAHLVPLSGQTVLLQLNLSARHENSFHHIFTKT